MEGTRRSAFAPLRANADTGAEAFAGLLDAGQQRGVGVRQGAKADLQMARLSQIVFDVREDGRM